MVISTNEMSILCALGMLHGMNVVSAEGIVDKVLRRVTEVPSQDWSNGIPVIVHCPDGEQCCS